MRMPFGVSPPKPPNETGRPPSTHSSSPPSGLERLRASQPSGEPEYQVVLGLALEQVIAGALEEGRCVRLPLDVHAVYEEAVIVIPPRDFCSRVTWTSSPASSSALATSSRILTASASQKRPSFLKPAR
jgi:hypothetical protein